MYRIAPLNGFYLDLWCYTNKLIIIIIIMYRLHVIAGAVNIVPSVDALCYVNGKRVTDPIVLKTGSRVILGMSHVFRFNHPDQGMVSRNGESRVVYSIQ